MKNIYVVHLAILIKYTDIVDFAEQVVLAVEGHDAANELATKCKQLNESYGDLYEVSEPVTLLAALTGVSGTVDELAAYVENAIQNGEKRFAEHIGQVIPDTDSELERIRRGLKS